jgi:hypothetical protein
MAEIPIQRKERRNLLPLILGALVLLALLGWCVTRDRGATAAGDMPAVDTGMSVSGAATGAAAGAAGGADSAASAGGAAAGGAGATSDFVSYVAARDTAQETEGNHQYTAGGVRRLAAALEQVAGTSPSIQVYADSMRSSVDRLQKSADTDVHADDAKAAFNAAVSAMTAIDKARGTTRDVAPMRAIAGELSSSRPLVPQLPVVQRFFEAASTALQAMGAAPAS